MISRLTSLVSLPYFNTIKYGIYIVIATSVITWGTTTYLSNIRDAKELGAAEERLKQEKAISKSAKELYDYGKQIRDDIDGNTAADNLRLLDDSIIIVPDDRESSPTLRPKLDSSPNDTEGQGDSSNNESNVSPLVIDPRAGTNKPPENLSTPCWTITFDSEFGYILTDTCRN